MGKLKLDLDEIKVESFETSLNDRNKKGTILGASGISDGCVDVDCALTPSCQNPTEDYGSECSNLTPCLPSWDGCSFIGWGCDRTCFWPECT
jgi:hypothetical protein